MGRFEPDLRGNNVSLSSFHSSPRQLFESGPNRFFDGCGCELKSRMNCRQKFIAWPWEYLANRMAKREAKEAASALKVPT